MSRPTSHRPPPPLADISVLGPEQDLLDPSVGQSIHYLEHGSSSPLVRWHYHPAYELHLIVASRGIAYVGDYQGAFGPYMLTLTGPNVPHNWISAHDSAPAPLRDMVIMFSEGFVRRCMEFFPAARHVRGLLLEEARYGLVFSEALGRQLEPWFRRVREHAGLRRVASFFELIEALVEDRGRRPLSSRPFHAGGDLSHSLRLQQAVAYIERHYAGDVSLDTVAAALAMSGSGFSRFFHRHTGYRFIDYLSQTRVQRACERLASADTPITAICYEVGFSNLSNFNRRFRALTGLTPREYRQQKRSA